jgi:agmatine deiminase
MVVDPPDIAAARTYLSAAIDLVEVPLDDAWMRDIGPTFVTDDGGRLGGVDWVFNGWGQQDWATWDKDSGVGAEVVRLAGAELLDSPLVNEGGGIQVDGLGTVLVTETVQLDKFRNPHRTKADVEAELARTIGATHVIWLPRGLTRDSQELGTRGHVDIVAAIPSPGVLLVHSQRNPSHPDFPITADIIAMLAGTRDAQGRAWDIVEVPAPDTLRDELDWVDYSYINHLVVNGGVIACSFEDPADAGARRILEQAYPGRKVVMVDARPIFARGGGIHCITQHQPAV